MRALFYVSGFILIAVYPAFCGATCCMAVIPLYCVEILLHKTDQIY